MNESINQSSSHIDPDLFGPFPAWKGVVEPGWIPNFLGVRTRARYFTADDGSDHRRAFAATHPPLDEEYFEWVDLLHAVRSAEGTFCMVELGAGWGRWMVNGAFAAKSLGLDFRVVGVEAEPTHFKWLKQHLKDNGIPASKRSLYQAAVATEAGTVPFHVGEPIEWYGQAIADVEPVPVDGIRERVRTRFSRQSDQERRIAVVKAITLEEVLAPLSRVDLVDADIQGAEADVVEGSRQILDEKVKRVHLGTHSAEIEDRLRKTFDALGWEKVHDYRCLSTNETPWGPVEFGDGVQSWINPRL